MIPLKLTPKQSDMCREFWPIFTHLHEESCLIADTFNREERLWRYIKELAEEAFTLGRQVGRDELAEEIEQRLCNHEHTFTNNGGVCVKCGATTLQDSSD